MRSTTTYSRGDVVYVPFKFTQKEAAKNRPAIVISSSRYHESRREVIIAGITSNMTRHLVGQMPIRQWRDCGLRTESVVSGIIQTVRDTVINRRVGVLGRTDLESLDIVLRDVLSL